MTTLWRALTTFVFLNALAVAGLLGWLVMTDRIDRDRGRELVAMFDETVAERDARVAAEEALARAEAEEQEREALPDNPPLPSDELIGIRLASTDLDEQVRQQFITQIENLRRGLDNDRRLLERERADFAKEKADFQEMREQIAAIEGDSQFRKTVNVLNGLKAADAKSALEPLLDRGEMTQVVSYLNAMEERARTKLVGEFIKNGDADLAADLLESLRTHGMLAGGGGETGE